MQSNDENENVLMKKTNEYEKGSLKSLLERCQGQCANMLLEHATL